MRRNPFMTFSVLPRVPPTEASFLNYL